MSAGVVRYDCSTVAGRAAGLAEAAEAVSRGELVVLPTDTVYGVGAGAFDPASVERLLRAKGRCRGMPSPVLVAAQEVLDDLVSDLPAPGWALVEAFWPGGLTLVVRQRPGLNWDLGETHGTVAVRMPSHPVALDLLTATGPLAVSSANLTGQPSPPDCDAARAMLGDSVAVYLDGGPTPAAIASSIVDLTGAVPVLTRAGAISAQRLRTVVPTLRDATGG
ncbi:L-threonylcarbamoyladenylate synthase [Nocardia sp. NPDC057440]|uniref:L-threonylcarbamoyladenylate synthase n=1 Tax=Nocardia sp. NPDC057440 TaxID=3346134 RepID=UPI00367298FE